MTNRLSEFFGSPGYFTEWKNPRKGNQHATRAEQLRAIRDMLDEARKQEYAEWSAAETGISELPSVENRQRAIILRVRIVEIIKTAMAIGFTREELT